MRQICKKCRLKMLDSRFKGNASWSIMHWHLHWTVSRPRQPENQLGAHSQKPMIISSLAGKVCESSKTNSSQRTEFFLFQIIHRGIETAGRLCGIFLAMQFTRNAVHAIFNFFLSPFARCNFLFRLFRYIFLIRVVYSPITYSRA